MILVKINYHFNCEDKGELELKVNCPKSEAKAVEQYIEEFIVKNPFMTSSECFINELKRFGFEAKEVKYDVNIC